MSILYLAEEYLMSRKATKNASRYMAANIIKEYGVTTHVRPQSNTIMMNLTSQTQ